MGELSLIVAAVAVVVSIVSGYKTYRLSQKGTALSERQTELAERQTQIIERQAEAEDERRRRALLPELRITPGSISNDAGGAVWAVRVRNSGPTEAREVQLLGMPDEGEPVFSDEMVDISPGDERSFQLRFPASVITGIGSMDSLPAYYALHAVDRDSNEFIREP